MYEINNTGNTESLKRVENKKTKEVEAAKETCQEQKTGDLSGQMEYLGVINRVNINKETGKNVSFRGSAAHNKDLKVLSDKKFKKLKKEIYEKIVQNPELQGYISYFIINKNNILLFDKILSDERLYNYPDFMKAARNIIYFSNTPERIQITDKILSDERLFDNSDFMKKAGDIFYSADTPEKAQVNAM